VVLGDDEALMVGGGGDLDEDAAGGSVAVGRGDEVMVKDYLDGRGLADSFDAGLDGGRDADVDAGSVGDNCTGGNGEEDGQTEAAHGCIRFGRAFL
jgi:hypothetical protein